MEINQIETQIGLEDTDRIIIDKIDSWYQEQISPDQSGQLATVSSSGQLATVSSSGQLATVSSSGQLATVSLAGQVATVPCTEQLTKYQQLHSPNDDVLLSPGSIAASPGSVAMPSPGGSVVTLSPAGNMSPGSNVTILSPALSVSPESMFVSLPEDISESGNSFTNPVFISDATTVQLKSEPFSPSQSSQSISVLLEPRAGQDSNPCPPKRMKREVSVTSREDEMRPVNFTDFLTLQSFGGAILNVNVDKGFHYSEQDQALINQKKNHIQLKVEISSIYTPKHVEGHQVSHLQLNMYGVKLEAQNQKIELEQSDSKRAKKKFEPIRINLTDGKPWKTSIGRLHFSESTQGNDSRKGKPNPNQRYFVLVVAIEAVTTGGEVLTLNSLRTSDRIIVRASNPGQFEPEVAEPVWSKNGDGIFYPGKVGIGAPNQHPVALFVNGDIQTAGNILKPCDRRIKKDITPLSTRNQLQNINKIEVVEYNLRPEYLATIPEPERSKLGVKQVGVVAQDVSKVLPDAVVKNPDMWIVNKERLCLENIGAVKELSKQVEKTSRIVKDVSLSNDQMNKQNTEFLHKIEKRTEELEERMDDLHLNVNNLNRYSGQHTSLSMVSDFTSLGGKAPMLEVGQGGRHICKTRMSNKLQVCLGLAAAVITLSVLGILICVVSSYSQSTAMKADDTSILDLNSFQSNISRQIQGSENSTVEHEIQLKESTTKYFGDDKLENSVDIDGSNKKEESQAKNKYKAAPGSGHTDNLTLSNLPDVDSDDKTNNKVGVDDDVIKGNINREVAKERDGDVVKDLDGDVNGDDVDERSNEVEADSASKMVTGGKQANSVTRSQTGRGPESEVKEVPDIAEDPPVVVETTHEKPGPEDDVGIIAPENEKYSTKNNVIPVSTEKASSNKSTSTTHANLIGSAKEDKENKFETVEEDIENIIIDESSLQETDRTGQNGRTVALKDSKVDITNDQNLIDGVSTTRTKRLTVVNSAEEINEIIQKEKVV